VYVVDLCKMAVDLVVWLCMAEMEEGTGKVIYYKVFVTDSLSNSTNMSLLSRTA